MIEKHTSGYVTQEFDDDGHLKEQSFHAVDEVEWTRGGEDCDVPAEQSFYHPFDMVNPPTPRPNRDLLIGNFFRISLGGVDELAPTLGYKYKECVLESNVVRDVCQECGRDNCIHCFQDAVEGVDATHREDKETVENRLLGNGALNGIEAVVLACAAAGIDVESSRFQEAVETAIDAVGNSD